MNKKNLILGAGILVAAAGGYYLWRRSRVTNPAGGGQIIITPTNSAATKATTGDKLIAAGAATKGILDSIASLFKKNPVIAATTTPKTVAGLGLGEEEVNQFI
jgi:hypothetical protein